MKAPWSIFEALAAAGPRPAEDSLPADKKNYAERLSRHLATMLANALRPSFPGVTPGSDGTGQESRARSAHGFKKLDVNYSTPELGLGLGLSVKTLNFRDRKTRRYTKNYTRIDNELRAEAMDYHVRQPFAVLAAAVFLPWDACEDAKKEPSSFAAAISAFRFRSGRRQPTDDPQLFEILFVGLYKPDGSVLLLDVMKKPRKAGPPGAALTVELSGMLDEIRRTYDERNNPTFEYDEDL